MTSISCAAATKYFSPHDFPESVTCQNPEETVGGWGDLHMKNKWTGVVPLLRRCALGRGIWGSYTPSSPPCCLRLAANAVGTQKTSFTRGTNKGVQVCSRAPEGPHPCLALFPCNLSFPLLPSPHSMLSTNHFLKNPCLRL